MKKTLLLLSILFIMFAFTSCKKSEADKRLSYYKDCAKAEVTIELMRKLKKTDWNAIKEKYNVCLKLVKEIDDKYKTNYQAEIQDAIIKCSKNENTKVNQQTLAKGLQHVVVMKIRDLINSMGAADKKTRKNNVKEIAAIFEGIRPTFTRRDKDYFEGRKQLEAEADRFKIEQKAEGDRFKVEQEAKAKAEYIEKVGKSIEENVYGRDVLAATVSSEYFDTLGHSVIE